MLAHFRAYFLDQLSFTSFPCDLRVIINPEHVQQTLQLIKRTNNLIITCCLGLKPHSVISATFVIPAEAGIQVLET